MILLVDDDQVYCGHLAEILRHEFSNTVEAVHTGSDAASFLKKQGFPDAIVLDMAIPLDESDISASGSPGRAEELRGIEIASGFRNAGLDMRRVVVITAFHQVSLDHLVSLGINPNCILRKPSQVTDILHAIRIALASEKGH
jgi:CheY-like chemotaxis protein